MHESSGESAKHLRYELNVKEQVLKELFDYWELLKQKDARLTPGATIMNNRVSHSMATGALLLIILLTGSVLATANSIATVKQCASLVKGSDRSIKAERISVKGSDLANQLSRELTQLYIAPQNRNVKGSD